MVETDMGVDKVVGMVEKNMGLEGNPYNPGEEAEEAEVVGEKVEGMDTNMGMVDTDMGMVHMDMGNLGEYSLEEEAEVVGEKERGMVDTDMGLEGNLG